MTKTYINTDKTKFETFYHTDYTKVLDLNTIPLAHSVLYENQISLLRSILRTNIQKRKKMLSALEHPKAKIKYKVSKVDTLFSLIMGSKKGYSNLVAASRSKGFEFKPQNIDALAIAQYMATNKFEIDISLFDDIYLVLTQNIQATAEILNVLIPAFTAVSYIVDSLNGTPTFYSYKIDLRGANTNALKDKLNKDDPFSFANTVKKHVEKYYFNPDNIDYVRSTQYQKFNQFIALLRKCFEPETIRLSKRMKGYRYSINILFEVFGNELAIRTQNATRFRSVEIMNPPHYTSEPITPYVIDREFEFKRLGLQGE
ncbi:hypothetical protein [Alteromonas macleodii]|uniref:hypothetical protein n=1 Tax=Alteromonas macleodii TaxID=28108 RepID=UPI0031400E02|tara:strand:+ start:1523 stop:2464 length:942 start_codon:yes stop_codon:yes gene_type:complete